MKHPYRIGSALAFLLDACGRQAADWADWFKFDAFGTLGAYRAPRRRR